MSKEMKRKMKDASLVTVLLCVSMTIGFAVGGGDLKGPGMVVYFILLVLCLALSVGLVVDDEQ